MILPDIINKPEVKKIKSLIEAFSNQYAERKEIVLCSFMTLIAKENLLLIGLPGAAKSSIVKTIINGMIDIQYFEYLMTKDTTTEEILGPFKEHEKHYGNFIRITSNKLPEAHVAFLDEVLNASSDTLNSLLSIINEKTFIQNGIALNVPLISLFGSTNEASGDPEKAALMDRFLFRFPVEYIKEVNNFKSFLLGNFKATDIPDYHLTLTTKELLVVRVLSEKVNIPEEIICNIVDMRYKCFQKGIHPSDRRIRKSLLMLKIHALLKGRDTVDTTDLWLYKFILWSEFKDIEAVNSIVESY